VMYCRWKTFMAAFNAHCVDHNFTKPKVNRDLYLGPFSERKLEVQNGLMRYPVKDGPMVQSKFIIGLDIFDEVVGE